VAVHLSGYAEQVGLVIAVVLGPDGLAQLAKGVPLAVDLREQGLPRGKIVLAFGPDPEATAEKLVASDLSGLVDVLPADTTTTWRCPRCGFTQAAKTVGGEVGAFPLVDAGRGPTYAQCPNDGAVLEEVA